MSPSNGSPPPTTFLSRRNALTLLGGLGVGAVAAACAKTTGSSASAVSSTSTAGSPATTGLGSPGSSSTVTSTTAPVTSTAACVLTPEVTAGPYFIPGDHIRSDITEGSDGAPLTLAISVVDADTCAPIKDASVDIWHCDAGGIYSGFVAASKGGPPSGGGSSTDDTRFLRGIQMTDADGVATFQTIYPGWYRGRAVHIHVKVGVGSTVHTGQIFFDDNLTDAVYQRAPYSSHGTRDQRNSTDSIFASTPSTVAAVASSGDGYAGTITLAVQR